MGGAGSDPDSKADKMSVAPSITSPLRSPTGPLMSPTRSPSPTFGTQLRSRLEIAASRSPLRLRAALERSEAGKTSTSGRDSHLSWDQDSDFLLEAASMATTKETAPQTLETRPLVNNPVDSEEMEVVLNATMDKLDPTIDEIAASGERVASHMRVDVTSAIQPITSVQPSLNLRPLWKTPERPLPAPVQIGPKSKKPSQGFVQLRGRRIRERVSSDSDGSDFCRGPHPKIRGESRNSPSRRETKSISLLQMSSESKIPSNIDPDLVKAGEKSSPSESGPASLDDFSKKLMALDEPPSSSSRSGKTVEEVKKKLDFNERQQALMVSGKREEILWKREEERSRSRSNSTIRRERDAVLTSRAARQRTPTEGGNAGEREAGQPC